MANEVQTRGPGSGKTLYFRVMGASVNIGQFWNTNTNAFEAFNAANIANYAIGMTEQGTTNEYFGNFPTGITTPGLYDCAAYQQLGGGPVQGDPNVAQGDLAWNGAAPFSPTDSATSGLVSLISPMKVFRGQAIFNFPFKLVGSADHTSPFTSGVVSGQISRDGGPFGALQSGTLVAGYTELGLGWYSVNLTSGDLLAGTIALAFNALGISGGTADQRDFSFLLQRSSGSV